MRSRSSDNADARACDLARAATAAAAASASLARIASRIIASSSCRWIGLSDVSDENVGMRIVTSISQSARSSGSGARVVDSEPGSSGLYARGDHAHL